MMPTVLLLRGPRLLQILFGERVVGIDGKRLLQMRNRFRRTAFDEQQEAQVIPRFAIFRLERHERLESGSRLGELVVSRVGVSQDEVCAGRLRVVCKGLLGFANGFFTPARSEVGG